MVRLVNLHKSFGKLQVLTGVNLDIPRGKTTVILGPSGTGKSVLLKLITGLLAPDKGEVWFDGIRVDQANEEQLIAIRRRLGFLFQMGALFDSMTVGQNICFPLVEHTKLSPIHQAQRCDQVLRMVGLGGIETKMPAELSGGQRKRVGLARAIVLEPELVLYDEPTTGLDPIRSDVINELILSLRQRVRVTGVVVTHDMASARKVADRMVMLYDGKIIAQGEPDAFLNTTEPIVQRFIQGQADEEDLQRIRAGFEGINVNQT
ncbi:MAG: ABC transporter ATP-binding protein [Phycisphaerales bacterium]|nr:ABC transporter ATP-binding protein [Phycisphaerales bacterium]